MAHAAAVQLADQIFVQQALHVAAEIDEHAELAH